MSIKEAADFRLEIDGQLICENRRTPGGLISKCYEPAEFKIEWRDPTRGKVMLRICDACKHHMKDVAERIGADITVSRL